MIQQAIQAMFHERKATPVIVLDEMHLASNAVFDELRLILNFKMDSHNPYILILTAQPPIRAKLNINAHVPLRQRISIRCTLQGLAGPKGKRIGRLFGQTGFAGTGKQLWHTVGYFG